jgi:hypothetical protein
VEKDLERHVAPAIRGHMKDLLAAIDQRSKPVADIEQGFISSASCILANLAMKTGRTLRYDPVKHVVTGDAEATRLLTVPTGLRGNIPSPARSDPGAKTGTSAPTAAAADRGRPSSSAAPSP